MKRIRLLQSIGRDHVKLEPGLELCLEQNEAARFVHAGIAEWVPYQETVVEPQQTRVVRAQGNRTKHGKFG